MDPRFRGDDKKKEDVRFIYQRYLQAFKKGVYNYIKEEADPITQETVPRKYFSGGFDANKIEMDRAMSITHDAAMINAPAHAYSIQAQLSMPRTNQAMTTPQGPTPQKSG